jgi:hypothetical protein
MSMYSDDYEYASSRLSETIVRKGNEPVYIYGVSPGMKVTYQVIDKPGEDPGVCDIDELDLKPVPLGYCNFNKNASYLTRIPMRRDWRQGLRQGNYMSLNGVDARKIPNTALAKVIKGEYPTFKDCLELVKKLNSVAWHRHWAISNAGGLFHKGSAVPVCVILDGELKLSTKYQYLSEALKESL